MTHHLTVPLTVPDISHDARGDYDRLITTIQALAPRDAIPLLKQFLQTYPSFAVGHNDLGVLYQQAGNSTLALAHHEKACRLQPDNITLRKNLADFYAVELGWLDEAVDIYLEILRRNPRDTDALITLGRLGGAIEAGTPLEAPQHRMALEEQPPQAVVVQAVTEIPEPSRVFQTAAATVERPARSFDAWYKDAQNAVAEGRFADAGDCLGECLVLQPDNAVIYNDLGVISYKQGNVEAARVNYEKAVALAPAEAVFARNLADLYFVELGRTDDAITIYLDLQRRYPRDVETLINLGHICTAVGHAEEAKSFYRRALEIEPWNRDAREALSGGRDSSTPPETIPVQPVEELYAGASRLAADGDLAGACAGFEELTAAYGDFAPGYNDLGVVRYRLGDVAGACTAHEKAVELQPENVMFRKNLADLYFAELGRTDDAIHIYLELFNEQPRDVETLLALGQICTAVGHGTEAKSFFRRALEIEPWNRDAREALKQG